MQREELQSIRLELSNMSPQLDRDSCVGLFEICSLKSFHYVDFLSGQAGTVDLAHKFFFRWQC